jgi:hypothetical protein
MNIRNNNNNNNNNKVMCNPLKMCGQFPLIEHVERSIFERTPNIVKKIEEVRARNCALIAYFC